jgi:peroxiredoxin
MQTMRVRKSALITLVLAATFQQLQAVPPSEGCSTPARRANLDFTLRDVGGREVSLSEFRGNVVLINFWATWCAPCRVEIPDLVALHRKYQSRGLVILGVSVDDPVSVLAPFVAAYHMTYPVLVGAGHRDFLEAFGPLAAFPTSLLISRDGKVCARHVGVIETAGLERQIRLCSKPVS